MNIESSLAVGDVYGECLATLSSILASNASNQAKLSRIRPLFEFLDSYRDSAIDTYVAQASSSSYYAESSTTDTKSTYLSSYGSYGLDCSAYNQEEEETQIQPEEPHTTSVGRDILEEIHQIIETLIPNVEKIGLIKRLIRESRSSWNYVAEDEIVEASSDPAGEFVSSTSFSSPLHWNSRWQEAFSLRSIAGELKYDAIRTLAADFAASAERYGKIIISEIGIPVSKKTIKPVAGFGGQAGGQKYLVHGIFFKFALDFHGLYGGDRFAIKAAKHELKSVAFHMATEIDDLHYPIMCLVQYCGFCLIATSVLPISKSTIKYGCDNAGSNDRIVHASDPKLNEKMEQAAKKLNLNGKLCDGNLIYGPLDIEAHLGDDGRYYVLDLARLFPPASKNGFLYRLLRPELVMSHPESLNSDAFAKFDRSEQKQAHIDEVSRAVATIPERVRRVATNLLSQFDKTLYLLDSSVVADLLKVEGVNTRFLGLLYAELRNLHPPEEGKEETQLSWIVLVEMISRTAAWRLGEMWRSDIKDCKHVRDTFCKNIAVKYLSDISDVTQPSPARQALIQESQTYFGFKFTDSFWEKHATLFLGKCMVRICALAGLQMAESFITRQRDPDQCGWTAPDDAFDILEIRVRLSQLPMIALAHARFTMNHLQKSASFKRILEAAQRKSLVDFRFAFANWIRFEFPVVGNVITACKNVPLHMCQSMMEVCTEAATNMFKNLAKYWYKLDVTMKNGSLLSPGLMDGGRPRMAQLFLAYAKRFLAPKMWFLLLRMTFSIVHDDEELLEVGILGDPLAEDIALLPCANVFPILTRGRVAAEKAGKQQDSIILALVEANLRFYHDNFLDKTSLATAKALFDAAIKTNPIFKNHVKCRCRYHDITGDVSLLALKIALVGPNLFSSIPDETKLSLSSLSQLSLPAPWKADDATRKLSALLTGVNMIPLSQFVPKVQIIDLTIFSDPLPPQMIKDMCKAWKDSLETIYLPTIGFSAVPSVVEALRSCSKLRSVFVGAKERIDKHIVAQGLTKWAQTVSIQHLPS